MKEIFDTYVDNAFGGNYQATEKLKLFEYNYKNNFPKNKDVQILDIGIGRGEMLSCMKNWGYINYHGIDISPSTVNFCKTINLSCEHINNTTEWLKANQNKFELITILDVLEHIPKNDMIDLLIALKGALKKNGILIIQVPNLQAPDGQLHRYNDFTHEFGFIEHSLQQILITGGFHSFFFNGFEEIVGNKPKQIIAKIFRRIFWGITRFTRMINTNINPRILNPIFYCIVQND